MPSPHDVELLSTGGRESEEKFEKRRRTSICCGINPRRVSILPFERNGVSKRDFDCPPSVYTRITFTFSTNNIYRFIRCVCCPRKLVSYRSTATPPAAAYMKRKTFVLKYPSIDRYLIFPTTIRSKEFEEHKNKLVQRGITGPLRSPGRLETRMKEAPA